MARIKNSDGSFVADKFTLCARQFHKGRLKTFGVFVVLAYSRSLFRYMDLRDEILFGHSYDEPEYSTTTPHAVLPNCTKVELDRIGKQLTPEKCKKFRRQPYKQLCSFTKATGCIRATWLTDYYDDLHEKDDARRRRHDRGGDEEEALPERQRRRRQRQRWPFVGMSVGCNKGYDALDTLRMGTANGRFDKRTWHEAMHDDGAEIPEPYCSQERNVTDQFEVGGGGVRDGSERAGEMHCIEALPASYHRLKHSAEKMDIERDGFVVKNAVMMMAPEKETVLFPVGNTSKVGQEDTSLNDCKRGVQWKLDNHVCQEVDAFTLETYVKKHVQSEGPIHVLTIDVEGFDYDVLRGGKESVLGRVQYLEFEYNWIRPWKRHKLSDAIQMLNEHGFTCYWAGEGNLWRITGCWQEYYDIHHWGNVACVHRSQQELVERMEETFQRTLELERVW